MTFRTRRLSIRHAIDVRGFARAEGAKRIVRPARSGRDEKPHSWIVPFFSATPRHRRPSKKRNNPADELCSFFVPTGGRWKLTILPLAESTALFFPPLAFCPSSSLCCRHADSSNLRGRVVVYSRATLLSRLS